VRGARKYPVGRKQVLLRGPPSRHATCIGDEGAHWHTGTLASCMSKRLKSLNSQGGFDESTSSQSSIPPAPGTFSKPDLYSMPLHSCISPSSGQPDQPWELRSGHSGSIFPACQPSALSFTPQIMELAFEAVLEMATIMAVCDGRRHGPSK
jgi:hypothetical protein